MDFEYVFESEEITFYGIEVCEPILVEKYLMPVECGGSTTGFPNPSDDHVESILDLNQYLGIKSHTCFFVEAKGDSLIDAGITDKDLLVVDTSLDYREDDIVICSINQIFIAKFIKKIKGVYYLYSKNPNFEPVQIQEFDDVRIFGVVKSLTRKLRK